MRGRVRQSRNPFHAGALFAHRLSPPPAPSLAQPETTSWKAASTSADVLRAHPAGSGPAEHGAISCSVGKIFGSFATAGSSFCEDRPHAVDRRHVLDVIRDLRPRSPACTRSSGTRTPRRCSARRPGSPPGRRTVAAVGRPAPLGVLDSRSGSRPRTSPSAATMFPLVRSSVYSLPVNRRICPESPRLAELVDRREPVLLGRVLRDRSPRSAGRAGRCRASRQHLDLALVLRIEQVGHRVDLRRLGRVDPDAGLAALPRDRELAARVRGRLLELAAGCSGTPSAGRRG